MPGMHVPSLVVPAFERTGDEPVVPGQRGVDLLVAACGMTWVDPSHTHTPVWAAATSITDLAWSATGCSSDWNRDAIPQAAL